MKKLSTLLALSTLAIAGVLVSTAACDNGGAAEACNNDDDCEIDGDICIDEQCLPAECNDNVDCDLSAGGDGFGKDELDAGNDDCEDEDFVTVVDFSGSEICMTGADPAVGCGEGFTEVDADAPGGGTVAVCVSGDGVCAEGQCS